MRINQKAIEIQLAERGLTQTELATRCGLSRQSLNTVIRRGTCEPRTAGKLAAGLGVSLDKIIKEASYE